MRMLLLAAAAAAALFGIAVSASAECPNQYFDGRPVYVGGEPVARVCLPQSYPPCEPSGCPATAAPES